MLILLDQFGLFCFFAFFPLQVPSRKPTKLPSQSPTSSPTNVPTEKPTNIPAASFYATYAEGKTCEEAPSTPTFNTRNTDTCLQDCSTLYNAPFYFEMNGQGCFCIGYTCTLTSSQKRRDLKKKERQLATAAADTTVYKSFPAGDSRFTVPCGAGRRRLYADDSCDCCPVNTYWPLATEDTYECIPCASPYTAAVPCSPSANACHLSCRITRGRYWSPSLDKCQPCPKNTYWPENDPTLTCLPCPAGTHSLKGADRCK